MKEITLLLTLNKMKIISVNNLYKAKVSYRGGKAFPQIYKNPDAAKIESSIFAQMSAIKFTEAQLELLRTKKKFSFRYNFILKSGIKSRDLGNLEKSITDIFVKFVNTVLGIPKFDDSQILEIQMSKSIIPNASAEYIGLQIVESFHNPLFDDIPKPSRIYLRDPEYKKELTKYLKTPEVKEQKLKLFTDTDDEAKLDKCNTELYIISGDALNPLLSLTGLMLRLPSLLSGARDFIWIAIVKNETWSPELIKQLELTIGLFPALGIESDSVKIGIVSSPEEIVNL